MTLSDFRGTLSETAPPAPLPAALRALWHDAKGDWDRAHAVVQDEESADAAHVHAYLHRKEGDLGNARYWYRRAGHPEATTSLEDEWAAIVEELLHRA
ncbi:MAG: hypothetical protein ACRD2X_00530 [Vicinamibacteraceae bacterium]